MIWVAFSLGLFGSLHCLGMCGPLALGYSGLSGSKPGVSAAIHSALYNFGRVLSYMLLGFLFGLLSSVVTLSGMQNKLSIAAGVVLVFLFLMSLDLERVLGKIGWYRSFTKVIQAQISQRLRHKRPNPLLFGIINGFLPCGMVYLALAGALTAGNVFYSTSFMLFFGLGTFPALLSLMLGSKFVGFRSKIPYTKILPYVGLLLGVYLIIRGFMFELPKTLDVNFLPDFICH